MELPLIDLAQLLPNAAAPLRMGTRAAALGALRQSLSSVGFFYLTNHGISPALQSRLLAATAAFFHLPASEKEASALRGRPASGRGYQHLRESVTGGAADVHEAVDLYATLDPSDPTLTAAVGRLRASLAGTGAAAEAAAAALTTLVTAENARLPAALEAALDEYTASARVAAAATLLLITEAVGIDRAGAAGLAAGAFWNARLIHYPPVAVGGVPSPVASAGAGGEPADGGGGDGAGGGDAATAAAAAAADELGCGAHSDYGLLTFVLQSPDAATRGCLQVWAPHADGGAGSWVAADPPANAPADTLVVNVGDWLAAAAGGAIRSSRHRVVQPSRGVPRLSVPFFFEPALSAVPPPPPPPSLAAGRGGGADGAAADEPSGLVTRAGKPVCCYGEFLLAKVAGNFAFATAGGGRV